MYSLAQSVRARGHAGDPLPTVFPSLEEKGAKFLRGQLSLIVAGPGTGKSLIALAIALKAKVPTMYFSADADAFIQLTRAISIYTGWTTEESARVVLSGDLSAVDPKALDAPIRFDYSASPTTDSIELAMDAYEELYDDYPYLVVVDNITNVRGSGDDDDPFGGLESLNDYMHDMARRTGAHVTGLHHATGPYTDSDKPIPRSGVKGQITRVPELVLTVHKVDGEGYGPDLMCVSVVKNNGGKADPSGRDFAAFDFDGARMQLSDPMLT